MTTSHIGRHIQSKCVITSMAYTDTSVSMRVKMSREYACVIYSKVIWK
jgi:hypothetical protein